MEPMRIATVQFEHAAGDKAANFAKIEQFCADAERQGVELLLFPECCITGYWHLRGLSRDGVAALAEPIPSGPSTQRLIAMAQRYRLIVSAGLIELADDGRMFNSQVVAMPDGTHHRHRKIHCFVSEHLDSGDAFTLFDTPQGWRVGVLICYDCNLNENVRINALRGAQLLLAPHQTGGCWSKSPHMMGLVPRKLWDERKANPQAIEAEFKGPKGRGWLTTWLPARAHDNGLFIAFANGVGPDVDEVRTGNAMILDPFGRILSETWKADDVMVTAQLDPSLLETNFGKAFIRTRRPQLYGELTQPTGREVDVKISRFEDQGAGPAH